MPPETISEQMRYVIIWQDQGAAQAAPHPEIRETKPCKRPSLLLLQPYTSESSPVSAAMAMLRASSAMEIVKVGLAGRKLESS